LGQVPGSGCFHSPRIFHHIPGPERKGMLKPGQFFYIAGFQFPVYEGGFRVDNIAYTLPGGIDEFHGVLLLLLII
jgi:hypothetical protein